jgi:putative oxidoreductase
MLALALFGKILFGAYFLYSGINHFKHKNNYVGYAKFKGVPSPEIAVLLTGVMLIAGGAGILLGISPAYTQASAVILIAFMVPTTFMMHNFWKEKDAQAKSNEQIAFMKNVALIGALLMFL